MPSRSPCPSPEALAALAADAASALADEAREHAARCGDCAGRLAELRREAALFDELRALSKRRPGTDEPTEIPGYVLEEELSRGAQGVVYRARETESGATVALKVLPRARASRRSRVRFEREIDLVSRLRHPAIVRIRTSGIAGGEPYYAMDLIEGVRLDEWAAERPRPLRERLELFQRIADAVVHAHRRGVIHRDLKPGNVLVDAGGLPHVLDFGIGKAIGPEADEGFAERRVTLTGEFMGTLAYASPEQVSGDPGAVDTRTDVYSLGVMLYELVTGRLPYDVEGPVSSAIANITGARPAPPASVASEVDGELATILETALEKDPAVRYASVEALTDDVARYLAHEPIAARGRSTWYVLRKALRRHRVAVGTGAAVFLAAALGGALLLREHLRAERQRANAVLVREVFRDILDAASPQRMGADVKLLAIFEDVARSIETSLADAPDTQAAVQLTIGDTYRKLLMWQDAEPHLRAAVGRYRALSGSELELARALDRLGSVLSELGSAEAITVQEEALALRTGALPESDPVVAESERALGVALASTLVDEDGDPERAAALLASALERFRAAHGDEHPEVAETETCLARLDQWLDPARAEPLFAHALGVFERSGGDDARMIDCLNSYAALCQSQGRFDRAQELLDRSVRLTTRLFGDERSSEMLQRYARLHRAKGEPRTAERLSRLALAKALERWARKSPAAAPRLEALARDLAAADPEVAEPPYAAGFAALREFEGDGAFELASWMNALVELLHDQGRDGAVGPILDEARRIHCRAYGRDCPIRKTTLWLDARHLAAEGRHTDAVAVLDELLELMEGRGLEGSERAQEVRALRRDCRRASGLD